MQGISFAVYDAGQYRAGDILPNGYAVIDRAHDVVVAKNGYKYATWKVNGMGDTFWGHYFNDRDEAMADFRERSYSGR